MKRVTLWAVGLSIALLSTVAIAQVDFTFRRMGIVFRHGVPHLYFSVRDLLHGEPGRKLEGGLPQRLVVTHSAFRTGRRKPISAGGHSCRVVYDLWQASYRVQKTPDRGIEERFSTASREEVIDRCLVMRNVPLGRAEDFVSGRLIHVRTVAELNPLSTKTIARIRRWLARPGGGDTLDDAAFFGSFVSLFVNQKIGAAERTLALRSQHVRVP